MTIKIDPLKLDAIDLEALEREAYVTIDIGLAALVGKLIVAENRWLSLRVFVEDIDIDAEGAARAIVNEMIELEKKPS